MSFVSYAQNFEDVMLWRALRHVGQGFYIDIGANDPTIDSVTKSFYENGWHGINVEPLNAHFKDLLAERPRDINLCCAVGEKAGNLELFDSNIRGLATARLSVISRYIQGGYEGEYCRVPMRTLSDICEEHVSGEIHFLKIDVEGFEKEVIIGADFQKFRPWILVIEATTPNSTEETYEEWENLVFKAGYKFAYADGLNRFYVAKEHSDILFSLKYPPNFFDDFVLSVQVMSEAKAQYAEVRAGQAEARAQEAHIKAQEAETRAGLAEAKAQEAHAKAQEAEARAGQAEAKAQEAHAKAQEAEARAGQAEAKAQEAHAKAQEAETRAGLAEAALAAIYSSRSWRITAPLRWAGNVARWFVRGSIAWLTFAPGSRPRRILRRMLISIKSGISHRPLLKAVAVRLLSLFPQIDQRLRSIGNPRFSKHLDTSFSTEDGIEAINYLTPRARQIYLDLKASIRQPRKEQR
jgi:FkbM family methyltransferase